MKNFVLSIITLTLVAVFLINLRPSDIEGVVEETAEVVAEETFYTIAGTVRSRDTMDAIFERHNLGKNELASIYKTSKDIYNLSRLSVGKVYAFQIDKEMKNIVGMRYSIDDNTFLNVTKEDEGYNAEKVNVEYTRKVGSLYINVNGSLSNSMPNSNKEYLKMALDLSNIFAWDIDFTNDIRDGDTLKVLVEELWTGEVFRGFGNVLAAEFINNETRHTAYRFEYNGYTDYYDENGKSLRKTLMKSPLKFKYISSRFTKRRFHPKLRIYRPHLGVDYAADTGTPVSAAGSGTVVFAGYKGQNGRMVKLKHRNGYETYYGHLSRIPKKIKKYAKVSQGDIIGYVGSTGLATGPHLDYRIKKNGRYMNPLKLDLPRGTAVPESLMARFRSRVTGLESVLASLTRSIIAFNNSGKTAG